MAQLTFDRVGQKSIDNINHNQENLKYGQSIVKLKDKIGFFKDSIIIAAGPSIKRMDPIADIRKNNFNGKIVTSESGLYYCLNNELVPDLVVTIDPHESRIVRWFGNPDLTEEIEYSILTGMEAAVIRSNSWSMAGQGRIIRANHVNHYALHKMSGKQQTDGLFEAAFQCLSAAHCSLFAAAYSKTFNDENNRICYETTYGAFSRSFELTSDIIGEKIKAKFINGVLHITIPKSEEVKPAVKKITIN